MYIQKDLRRDEELKNNVIRALADEYSRAILSCIMDKPKSVIEISNECNIPISTTYRRIHELEGQGLVKISGSIINNDGKRFYLYKSKIKSVRITFGLNTMDIELIYNNDMGKSAYW